MSGWPKGFETGVEFYDAYYSVLDYRDEIFVNDEDDVHVHGVKVNGFAGEWTRSQRGAWVLLLVHSVHSFVFVVPMLRDPAGDYMLVFLTLAASGVLITMVACMLTQSADFAVFGTKRWSMDEWVDFIRIKYRDHWQGGLFESHPRRLELVDIRDRKKKWCPYCHVAVDVGSYHCNSTNTCITEMDHFCMWLNSAVGKKNYHLFAVFTLLCFWTCVIGFAVGVYEFVDSFQDPAFYRIRLISVYDTSLDHSVRWFRAFSFLGIVLSLVGIVQLGFLYGFHLMLFRTSRASTLHYWKSKVYRDEQKAQKQVESRKQSEDEEEARRATET
ncbi:Protein S-acyltransferase 21 [Diplonema papillatum]|nr:Protein S-acyltransferase 21 [Diplonema papillatum]KAJ9457453.1 Protein S-acyltransferase 21 [Diplonema papillatum]KAJ9457454.1 Protein S-acyltransferase 21 [Diplonema papillatum]